MKTTIKKITNCDFCHSETENTLVIPIELDQKIRAMTIAMGSTEWLGYFDIDEDKESGDLRMKDLRIPDQEVSGASVEVESTEPAYGSVHSHHSMGAFHSGTDEDSVGGNHNLVVVYSTQDGGTYKAKQKVALPCKSYKLLDIDVFIEEPESPDLTDWVEESKKHIKPRVWAFPGYTQPGLPGVNYYDGEVYGDGSYMDLNHTTEVCSICKGVIHPYEGIRVGSVWQHDQDIFCSGRKTAFTTSTKKDSAISSPASIAATPPMICAKCRTHISPSFIFYDKEGIAYHWACLPESSKPTASKFNPQVEIPPGS